MKIYLATWMEEPQQGVALTKKNMKNRLLSYFFLKKKTREQVKNYCREGVQ